MVAIAVPVSLLAAFAVLYLFGDTLNLLTLFGLALAVGLLVDNSVSYSSRCNAPWTGARHPMRPCARGCAAPCAP